MLYISLSSIVLTYICILVSNSYYISNYAMPFIAYTMILSIFTKPVLAFFASILMLGILSSTLFFDSQLVFVYICAIVSSSYLVARISYSKRFDIIWCGLQVGAVMTFVMFFVSFFETHGQSISKILQLHSAYGSSSSIACRYFYSQSQRPSLQPFL